MALERTTNLYEILLRFGPDGLSGAHVIDQEKVIDTETGEVLATKDGAARPVTLKEVGTYLGAKNAELLEAIGTARAEADQLRGDLAACAAERDRKSADLALAEARLAAIAGALTADQA